ncbi:MAG: hypothetical protein ACK4Y6_02050 [Bacteroidota bacterium]|jgi:hypothetical protein
MRQSIFLLAIMLLALTGNTQPKTAGARQDQSSVRMYGDSKSITRLALKQAPVFERVNNQLNVSIELNNGGMLQVNGIPDRFLKDTTLTTQLVKLVYINATHDTTYTSNTKRSPTSLTIQCKSRKTGSPLSIFVSSRVFNGKRALRFELTATGNLPANEFRGINK